MSWSGDGGIWGLPLLQTRYVRNEAIASTRYIRNVAVAGSAVAQDLAKGTNMDPEIGLLDEGAWPDTGQQLILADKLSSSLDQRDQDIERTTTQTKRLVGFEQHPPRRNKPKTPECQRFLGQKARMFKFTPIYRNLLDKAYSNRRTAV